MKRIRIAALASAAIAVASVAAYAAGNWSTVPIVGMASFCASTVTGAVLPAAQGPYGLVPGSTQGTSIGICQSTVPAGPPTLTGNELVPADTGLPGSQPPQTVTIPSVLLGAAAPYYLSLTATISPNSFTVPGGVGTLDILGAAALSPTTVQMTAAPFDGQILRLTSDALIATLTISPNTGQTIQTDALVTSISPIVTGPYGYGFIYRASNTTWYRLY